jgi:pimeloyl-ACP methyl ester carboxylesterase
VSDDHVAGAIVTKRTRSHVEDLRGASRLAIDATRGVTAVVEDMHVAIASGPAVLGRPLSTPARLVTRPIYGMIRGVMSLVGSSIDLVLAPLAPLLGASVPGAEREAVLAVLNGVLGDHLAEQNNPLASAMALRHGGEPLEISPEALRLELPGATGKLAVLVHGLCATDRQWTRRGHDHGAALARDLGYTPVYLHYNSGLHISTNGRAFAALLEQLVTAWPVALEDLVIIGHSMGGLVARSAVHAADQAGHRWRPRLRSLIMIGTPHHGAPLERGGSWVDLVFGVSRYTAPLARLGQIRSAGITDLRFGNVVDEDWQGLDRFAHRGDRRRPQALPADLQCGAIAGTLATEAPDPRLGRRADRLPGDGLVPVDSALGRHAIPELTLELPESRRSIVLATGHLDLLGSPTVYATIRSWLSPEQSAPEREPGQQ